METQIIPYGKIASSQDLGRLVRFRRKELKATQAMVAGLSGVGHRFISELERGKVTVELGKTLLVLQRLGLDIAIRPRGEQK